LAGEATGTKKQRDQLRATLRDQGCTLGQIAAEMSRQFGFRARQAWRHAHGWTQSEAAAAYNRHIGGDHAPMTGKRISDYEAWPHGGKKPTINALATLARAYSTEVLKLVDLDDRRAFNTQELLTLDTYKKPPPTSPDTPPDNNVQNLAAADEGTVQPEPNISIAINQASHMLETATPSKRRWRWHLAIACLLAILAAIGGAMTAQEIARKPHTIMPVPTSTPSPSGAPIPSSASALPPPLPSQTAPPRQPLTPLTPLISATPAPHQPPIRTPPPPSPSAQPDPQPPPPESPTTKTASASTTATTMWKNVQTDWCLEEEENDALTVWPCDGRADQMWAEQIIPAHPESFTRNLVNSKSGKCVTYQPEPGGHISVSLAPCGKDGQGWIRGWNGTAYIFQPAEIPDKMCMSAPMDIAAEGTRVQLRKCDPPSPLTEWQPSPNN
jgi:transcriptional regulator with XRE-family HTH domain